MTFGRYWTAMTNGYRAFRATLNPETDTAGGFTPRSDEYRLLWAYYRNTAFERIGTGDVWATYRNNYRLFPFIRPFFNPVKRLVDFYVGAVYPGVLAADGKQLPDGIPLAIPLAEDTDRRLKEAIGQLWQWSNWQTGKDRMVRYGAALGSAFVEVVDDLDRRKVTFETHWPGRVSDLTLDPSGNVKAYVLEYDAEERGASGERQKYRFRREVTQETIREYRAGTLAYEDVNPYGFAPAVWVKHSDLGSDHGAPAIDGAIGKVDLLNDLASRLDHQIARVIDSPQIIFGGGRISNAIDTETQATLAEAERRLTLLKAPEAGSVAELAGNLDIAATLPWMDRKLAELEADFPELGTFQRLREMSQVTGPAIARMLGDVQGRVWAAAANYDNATTKLLQMGVAIAGWRTRNGWAADRSDRQRAAFLPFDLESYERGALDVSITPRPLVPETDMERWAAESARADAAEKWSALYGSRVAGLDRVGVTPEELAGVFTRQAANIQAERLLAQSDIPLDGTEIPEQ
jgi:hypothetical protein